MPEILYFPYFGPGRRSDKRVVEIRLDFGPDKAYVPELQTPEIRQQLLQAGILENEDAFPGKARGSEDLVGYLEKMAQTALLFQNKNGHRVKFFAVSFAPDRNRYVVLVEHEHSAVGMAAVKMATDIFFPGKMTSLTDVYLLFSRFAREHVLPLETQAIIDAAKKRNISVFQLEREPLAGRFNIGAPVRPNGMLLLGHGVNSHTLDGTFCVDKAGDYLKALLRNPAQRYDLIKQMGIPVRRNQVSELAGGRMFTLLIINHRVTAIEQLANDSLRVVSELHESLVDMCRAISTRVASAAIAISLEASDLSLSLSQSGGRLIDFDLAPDLYQLLGKCEEGQALLDIAVNDLLDWLFAGSESTHFPVIAVTGTNGKTTTCRMINHVLQTAAFKPGMVCTDGIYLAGKQFSNTDAASFIGHARVLTSRQVGAAVLESHHRGIAIRGFAFQNCDVAVCLNVTEEHLKEGEIESLGEMATIKRALLERTSNTAVLFADDARCLGMVEHLDAENICLVSLRFDVAYLQGFVPSEQACFCVLETREQESWIILYAGSERVSVMPVSGIPATFDGKARFNVANAMHAIAASYFSGIDVGSIRSALAVFCSGEEFTPGRMNVFDELGFRVIIDFAHNPDGFKNVCDFVSSTTVKGRKLTAFAGMRGRTDVANTNVARAIAGHFDFYFCKDYEPVDGRERPRQAPFMQKALIGEGVSVEHTEVVGYGRDVIYGILDACEPGDLLVLFLGYAEKQTVPGFIRDYARQKSDEP